MYSPALVMTYKLYVQCVCSCVDVHVCVCDCVYKCVYMCVYACVATFTHAHTCKRIPQAPIRQTQPLYTILF